MNIIDHEIIIKLNVYNNSKRPDLLKNIKREIISLCITVILDGLKSDSLTELTKTNLEELFWNCLEDNLVYLPKEVHQFFTKIWLSSEIKEILNNLIEKETDLPYFWEDEPDSPDFG